MLRPDRLEQPLKWTRPRTIFVNSMGDLFHEGIPESYIQRVFEVMGQACWHTFQVLTKRHRRLLELAHKLPWPSNVWMGVSVENQRWASRADYLKQVPSTVRFVSVEPLLGPVRIDLSELHWIIVGGESGPRARRMKPAWVRSLREQAREANVPFFFKQWGTYDEAGRRVGKGRAGRLLDGRTWDEMPRSSEATASSLIEAYPVPSPA